MAAPRSFQQTDRDHTPTMNHSQSCVDLILHSDETQVEWTALTPTGDDDLLPACPSDSFIRPSTETTHGLGLMFSPLAIDQTYDTAPQTSRHDQVSYWSSDWTAAQVPSTSSVLHRLDPSSGSCNPVYTVLSTTWDSPCPKSDALMHEESSSISSYSTSSNPSAVSSPYVRPGTIVRGTESPAVKVEYVSPQYDALVHYRHVHTTPEQSLLVNPSDLVARPASTETGYAPIEYASPLPNVGDEKPVLQSQHQYYLPEGPPRALFADGPRRALTKRENGKWFCGLCKAPFQRQYNLKAHMATHDKHRERPAVCGYAGCPHAFTRRADLVRHTESVSHDCENCIQEQAFDKPLETHQVTQLVLPDVF